MEECERCDKIISITGYELFSEFIINGEVLCQSCKEKKKMMVAQNEKQKLVTAKIEKVT